MKASHQIKQKDPMVIIHYPNGDQIVIPLETYSDILVHASMDLSRVMQKQISVSRTTQKALYTLRTLLIYIKKVL